MTQRFSRRVAAVVYGVALLFLGTLATVAASITWEARGRAIENAETQAMRFVGGSEAALNRALLSIDMLLAGAGEQLRAVPRERLAEEAGRPEVQRLIVNLVRQNLLVRFVAFVDADGTPLASSDRRGARLPMALPEGFARSVLAQPLSTMAVSAPIASPATLQKVVFFARAVPLADGSRVLAVAEVQISLLAMVTTQGASIPGLEITLERDAGPLLVSVPARDDLLGRQLEPALSEQTSDGKPVRMAARLSGVPAILVARPTLHRNLLIVASIPLAAALRDWREERDRIAWTGAVIGALILAIAAFTHLQLRRQWQSRQELVRSKATLDQALESMIGGFVLLDADDRVLAWNHSFVAMFPWVRPLLAPQLPFRELVAETARHVVHEGGPPGWMALNMPQLAQDHSEQEAVLEDGRVLHATRSRTPDGGTVCVYQDITEKRRHMAAIVESKAQLQATLEALPDLLLEVGLDGICHGHHAPRVPLPGIQVDQPAGRRLQELLPPQASAEVMAALKEANETGRSSGRQFERRYARSKAWFEISVSRKASGAQADPRFIVILRNITESKQAADEVEQLAFYDTLTGLPNRRLLVDRIKHAIDAVPGRSRWSALLFLDLDNFKTVNDAHGHDTGDVMLKQVAQRLTACLRRGDTVARLGGDEFVVMLAELHERRLIATSETEAMGAAILEQLNRPYQLGGQQHHSTCSIGVALFDTADASLDEVIKQADIAMYYAKTAGGNALRFFETSMQTSITARAALENELHAAVEQRQFVLHYQSQVTSEDRVVAAEVLVRWQHPTRGLLAPGEFIAAAEDTGLIIPLGLWVLETACRQLAAWSEDPRRAHLQLSVNVSARQFRTDDFVKQVARVLERTGADPRQLKLELTESLLQFKVADTIAKMKTLAGMGIQFSMDDFGTGFSSLSYMIQLPLNQIKVDKYFVHGIGLNPKVELVIQTIIGMALNLELQIVAEGVETQAQREFLARHGCHLYQGYLFGKPKALEAYEQDLDAQA
ncbi:PAS domain S-box-containing protein/diguanylate cyclase (GGDEF) domain-containing protein [Variovorax sp. PDC80]|uniref:bifunctional diguanylate cyclase/phosphodiesterase n=1 Tax=Variovorax sp. PDC80 TaxID=1882827 RepID=UPI0008DF6750|nr:EAL domain-containing protein [Variovorax sp. PDC80]SFO79215.1 PAS domain S-box-containing protein/diguanylate cyclase (GGDEF) domain-containing protein [Variovorax sp. PDC80]